MVKLKNEIIENWVTGEKLDIFQQDEEIILAEGRYLEDILLLLDNYTLSKYQRQVLITALCIIVYDNSYDEELGEYNSEDYSLELRDKVIKELNKRLDDVLDVENYLLLPYVKKVVYPQLGLYRARVSKIDFK